MQLGLVERDDNICRLCPRRCGVKRTEVRGFCGAGDEMEVSSVCLHRGEEPPLNPIVNVFFTHCNLQCVYCQNWQISGKKSVEPFHEMALQERICDLLPQSGGMLGLVTAAHYADRIPALIEAIRTRLSSLPTPLGRGVGGEALTVVYNSGGYESVETLRSLEGLVDVYLPDLKYMDSDLAARYSHAPDYPEVAAAALLEMKRQVGGGLITDDRGAACRGMIVRHLVLPGATDNSLRCLEWLADNFNPFTLHLSLMAQYFPPRTGLPAPLDRTLTADEYAVVTARAEELGFIKGWGQELEARNNYRPDFDRKDNPFE